MRAYGRKAHDEEADGHDLSFAVFLIGQFTQRILDEGKGDEHDDQNDADIFPPEAHGRFK